MGRFPVTPAKETALEEEMRSLDIREEDVEEWFVRSSGKGGQRTNKVSTCVCLRHKPTGVEVKYGKGRSQGLNRYKARVILVGKIDGLVKGAGSKEAKRAERIRRQKSRRAARARAKTAGKVEASGPADNG